QKGQGKDRYVDGTKQLADFAKFSRPSHNKSASKDKLTDILKTAVNLGFLILRSILLFRPAGLQVI
ncbi:unnamed protein product, partial [marine sediment metagenome]